MKADRGWNLHIDSTTVVPALPHFKENFMPAQYHISLPDPSKARGNDPDLSFHSQGTAGFAEELQDALRSGTLFERWKAKQPDPDAVEPQWGVPPADSRPSPTTGANPPQFSQTPSMAPPVTRRSVPTAIPKTECPQSPQQG